MARKWLNWLMTLLLKTYIRAWWALSGGFEALFHLGSWRKAKKALREAKNSIKTSQNLENWYRTQGFKYERDFFDCGSYPWVTVDKKYGDCEDFMRLSYYILKDKAECVRGACYGRNEEGKRRGHAFLLVREEGDEDWSLLSNQRRYAYFATKERAAKHRYREQTTSYHLLD